MLSHGFFVGRLAHVALMWYSRIIAMLWSQQDVHSLIIVVQNLMVLQFLD